MKWLILLLILTNNPPLLLRWVDKAGVVHIADDITNVPEPYHSIYWQKLEELKAKGKVVEDEKGRVTSTHQTENKRAPKAYEPSSSFSPAPAKAATSGDKSYWQNLLKSAQQKLLNLTNNYARLGEEIGKLQSQGEMAFLPANRQKRADLEREKARTWQELQETKTYIERDLPEQARKAGVPPGWVR